MNAFQLEQFEDYSRLFAVYCEGIENHLDGNPDKKIVVDTLLLMEQMLNNIIESCRQIETDTIKDFAAYVCDEHCDKVRKAKSQKELDSFCRECPLTAQMEGRC